MNVLRGRRRTGVAGAAAGGLAVAVVIALALVDNARGPSLGGGEHAAQPLALGREALWDMEQVRGAAVHGGSVVVLGTGTKGEDYPAVAVRDLRTGENRWSRRDGARLDDDGARLASAVSSAPGHGDHVRPVLDTDGEGDGDSKAEGEAWSVLVEYWTEREGTYPESGVAALSGRNGRLLWKRPLPGSRGVDLMDARGGRVLAVGRDGSLDRKPITYVLDARRGGRPLWRHKGDDVMLGLAGNVVLGEYRRDYAIPEGSVVVARDMRTGKKLWDLAGYPESSFAAAVPGRAVVRTVGAREFGDAEHVGSHVLDPATGAKTDDLGRGRQHCAADARDRLLACVKADGSLLTTIRAGRHSAPVRAGVGALEGERPYYNRSVDLVRNGRVYVGVGSGITERSVVDRLGRTLRTSLPGSVLDVTDGYAVLLDDRTGGSERLVVHRVREERR